MKEVADFKVFTKGAGSGELKVTVKGPSEYQGPGGREGARCRERQHRVGGGCDLMWRDGAGPDP